MQQIINKGKQTKKVFAFPVTSGGGASFKKYVTDANKNIKPTKVRTMITAIFIIVPNSFHLLKVFYCNHKDLFKFGATTYPSCYSECF